MTIRLILAAMIALNCGVSSSGHAQSAHDKDCDKAAKTVQNGHPAHKLTAALNTLSGCGALGGQTTAAAVQGTRLETDTTALEEFYTIADMWRDASVMQAAINLAQDAGASSQARVYAVRHLLRVVRPRSIFRYGNLVRGNVTTVAADSTIAIRPGCRESSVGSVPALVGSQLPPDYRVRIRELLATLASSSSSDIRLQNAAKCG
jgi:hypothetical protein